MKKIRFAPKLLVLSLGMFLAPALLFSPSDAPAKDAGVADLPKNPKRYLSQFIDKHKMRLRAAPKPVSDPGSRALAAFNRGDLEKAHSVILKATLGHSSKQATQNQSQKKDALMDIRDNISFHYLKDLVTHNKLPKNLLSPSLAMSHLDKRGYRSDNLDVYCFPTRIEERKDRSKQCSDALPVNDVLHYLEKIEQR
ncbi:MAG: hypothetical protein KQH63_15035 [Desulfobulbaceae bacterium]|nr:hypothetical protein [Desulfobulbaceae bacterium]